MKRVLAFQILILAIGSLALFFSETRHGVSSFASGGFVITLNFILLGAGWNLIFRKKLIALSVLIIVFKYAILGVIIYHLVKQNWLSPFWFAAGIASIVLASLTYGLTLDFFKEE
jgi:hypothetical protein